MDPVLPAVGVFLTLFIHYFFLYLGRRQNKSNLFYSLFCLSIISIIYILKIYPDSSFFVRSFYNSLKVFNCVIISTVLTFFAYTVFNFTKIKKISLILMGVLVFLSLIFNTLYLIDKAYVLIKTQYFILLAYILVQSSFMLIQIVLSRQYVDRNRILIMIGYFAFIIQGLWFLILEGILDRPAVTVLQRPGTIIMIVLFTYVLMDNYNRQQGNLLELKETLERKVEERTLQLQQANRQKSMFFVNLAHETKTPLTLIRSYFENHMDKNGHTPETRVVKRNIDKLIQDIVNILNIEKLESGSSGFDHNQISDLTEIIGQKVILFKGMAGRRNIIIKTDLLNNAYTRIDPSALDIVINNLLDNAIKYNREYGYVYIRLKNKESNNQYLELVVEDNGIGMEDDKLESIFNQFYQISPVKRNAEGLGVGLSLVKSVLKDIGSEIHVETLKNEGSRFSVVFKSCRPSENDVIRNESGIVKTFADVPDINNIPQSVHDPNRHTVFAVDDNIDMIMLLADQISRKYNFYFALSGTEALEKLKRIPRPDIILSDVMMDDMDGSQFHKLLNQDTILSSIPVIFLTAKTCIDEEWTNVQNGAMDFMTKPFSMHVLMAKIEAITNYREKQKNLMLVEIGKRFHSILQNHSYESSSFIEIHEDLQESSSLLSKGKDFNISPRELEIIDLMNRGFLYKEIASHLSLSENTVETYRKRIFKKCNIQNKVELLNIFNKNYNTDIYASCNKSNIYSKLQKL